MTRVLVTNDDGIASEGLHALASMAEGEHLEVLVAAPAVESSGASASLGAVEADGRIVVEEVAIDGLDGVRALAVQAAPAFIVRGAAAGLFGEPPDVVLAGINRGQNTGHAIVHSGTVGAALTAATYGRPALAVSLATGGGGWHWTCAVELSRRVLPCLLDSARPIVFNLNVPNLPAEEVRGLRRAPLARFGVVQARVGELGHGYIDLEYGDVDPLQEPDSDAGLLAHGWASITPLRTITEGGDLDLGGVVDER